MNKSTAHFDHYQGTANHRLEVATSEIASVLTPLAELRPPEIPGLPPVVKYKRPQSEAENKERNRMTEIEPNNSLISIDCNARSASSFGIDTQDRSETAVYDFARMARAEWMPEVVYCEPEV